MQACPHCGELMVDPEAICPHCGREVSATGAQPQAATRTSDAPSDLPFLAAGFAALVVGAVVTVFFVRQPAAREDSVMALEGPVAPAAGMVAPAAAPDPKDAASSPPKWTGSRQPSRASDGSRTIAFELQAEHSLPVWGKRVRPVLGVRCLWGETEVFVMTHWAASIEPGIEGHSVQVAFDDEAPLDRRWSDSLDYQALFAPDAVPLTRRIAGARTMRFGFTPHNASPVVAEFDVRGFDELVGLVARTCRWKP